MRTIIIYSCFILIIDDKLTALIYKPLNNFCRLFDFIDQVFKSSLVKQLLPSYVFLALSQPRICIIQQHDIINCRDNVTCIQIIVQDYLFFNLPATCITKVVENPIRKIHLIILLNLAILANYQAHSAQNNNHMSMYPISYIIRILYLYACFK